MYCTTSSQQSTDTADKITTITEQIVSELKEDCNCAISKEYILDGELSCSGETTDVVFRAQIFSTPNTDCIILITGLQKWIESGLATVVVQGISLQTDPMCPLSPEDETVCPGVVPSPTDAPTEQEQEVADIDQLTIVVIGSVVGGVVLILVVIIALHIFTRCRRRSKYSVR